MEQSNFLTSNNDLDLTIFERDQTIECNNDNNNYKQCKSISRLVVALKYYSVLNTNNNEKHRDIFIHFISTIYQNILNDYIHFLKHHGKQIEDIRSYFINDYNFTDCNITNCTFTSRHHRSNSHERVQQQLQQTSITLSNQKEPLDSTFEFIQETMDGLHFYVFHLFEVGLRSSTKNNDKDKTKLNEEKLESEYFDEEFKRLKTRISETQERTKSFERFGTNENNKFSIKTEFDKKEEINDYKDNQINDNSDGMTYLDELYKHLNKNGVDINAINNLKKFIQTEQFDTDSLAMDVAIDGKQGNISRNVDDDECISAVIAFIHSSMSYVDILYTFFYDNDVDIDCKNVKDHLVFSTLD